MSKWRARFKKFWPALVLLAVAGWYLASYARTGLPVTHDSENHVARFAQYYLALRQGQLIPRLGPTLQNGYGYPVFNYNYPLANLLSLPLSALHVDFEWEFKLIIAVFFLVGAWGCWQWLRALFPHRSPLVPTLAFLLAPYLWTAIWYRGNIGEAVMYLLVPVLLWQFERFREHRRGSATFLIIVLAFFFLAHNVMVLFLSPVIVAYACWRLQLLDFRQCLNKKHFFGWSRLAGAVVVAAIGLGLSLWFWLPAFFEREFVVLSQASLSQEYALHFATWPQLLSAAVSAGLSYPGFVDGLSFGLGVVLVGVAGVSMVLLVWRREAFYYWRLGLVVTVLVLVLLWLQTAASAPVWTVVPLVNFIQFPWRLQLLVTLLLVTQLANLRPQPRGRGLVLVLLLVQVILYVWARPRVFYHHTREDYLQYPQSTTTVHENTPVDFHYDISREASREPVVTTGNGMVSAITRLETTRKDYRVTCADACIVVEHTAFFPGYQTYLDDVLAEYVDDATIGGRLAYQVPAGEYTVRTRFGEWTWARMLGDVASVLSLLALLVVAWREWRGE